jgi:hypothetical protein
LRLRHGADLQSTVDGLSRRFEGQLAVVARLSRESRVPTYVVIVPNNLRDWMPESDDSTIDPAVGLARAENGNPKAALDWLQAFPAAEKKNAIYWFLLGRAFEREGDFARAREAYVLAKDLDRNFLRTRSGWNEAIRRMEGPYVEVLDMEKILSQYARNGIPGSDLFLDYCHLTLAANRAVAFEIAKRLAADMDVPRKPLALDDIGLSPFTARQLRRLFWLRRIKWMAACWLSVRTPVDAINFRQEADQCADLIRTVDNQIRSLSRSESGAR